MKKFIVVIIISALTLTAYTCKAASQPKSGREKLGLRLGYSHSASDIKNEFGDGSVITLHFSERIKPPLFVDFTLGALYLGESSTDNITWALFGHGVSDANMRVLFFSISPMVEFPISQDKIFYLSAGVGLYSVSIFLEMGFFGSEISDEHFGATTGTGLLWPLSDNWMLDFNFTASHIWTAEKQSDIFFLYSGGDSDPDFYQFSIGAIINLK